jgi:outer membrane protein assembly factor BamB
MTGNRCRGIVAILAGVGLLIGCASLLSAPNRTVPVGEPINRETVDESGTPSGLTLPIDTSLRKKFDAIRDYTEEGTWAEVTRILQGLLDAKEDAFMPITSRDTDGKESTRWVSVRSEANRLLGSLPEAGRKFYEETHGKQAQTLLVDALKRHDVEQLARVAVNYFHTEAGRSATGLLGSELLERGEFVLAALCFDRLLALPEPPDVRILLQACMAQQLGGDRERAEEVWKLLTAKNPDGIVLERETIPLEEVRKELNEQVAVSGLITARRTWPVFRGNPNRTALPVAGTAPEPAPLWQRNAAAGPQVRAWLQDAVEQQEAKSLPVITAGCPIVLEGKVLWRTHSGVEAVEARTGKVVWETSGSMHWGLDQFAGESDSDTHSGALVHVDSWVMNHLQSSPSALFENGVVGTLSADSTQVYAVDDVAVPPTKLGQPGVQFAFRPGLSDAVFHSQLLAFNLQSGKCVWDLGGRAATGKGSVNSPLHDAYFLGPPLPLGGRLYTIIEKDQEFRLVCLDPAHGELLWSQFLGIPRNRLDQDGGRRLFAAPTAYGQGVLICPTNSGAVVAVDMLSHSLLWAHDYASEPYVKGELLGRRRTALVGRFDSFWKAAAPIVLGNSVLLAAPDGNSLECFNLLDGTRRWEVPRDDAVYVAVVGVDRVMLVGMKSCTALNLADGKEAWSLESAPPTGTGQLVSGLYYLPQKAGIAVLDVGKGKLVELIACGKTEPAGNLVWSDGLVFAQNVAGLTAFPQHTTRDEGEK